MVYNNRAVLCAIDKYATVTSQKTSTDNILISSSLGQASIQKDEVVENVEKKFKATRYHSLIIDKKSMPKDFVITAETNNKIIMGIAHKKLPIFGLQFHPEVNDSEYGAKIFENFVDICRRAL